ncbi:hypothetical protein AVEN_14093-1 [Araneus ventricosus]|uniref:Uncharacterized protein n=1 Tax=Araneus ventricosus TaxID=182803 RepID=A0A4Y2FXJ9_ARAVE|nr:hypothetical protein AVEN_14093-1 [Araneus ventricosus]
MFQKRLGKDRLVSVVIHLGRCSFSSKGSFLLFKNNRNALTTKKVKGIKRKKFPFNNSNSFYILLSSKLRLQRPPSRFLIASLPNKHHIIEEIIVKRMLQLITGLSNTDRRLVDGEIPFSVIPKTRERATRCQTCYPRKLQSDAVISVWEVICFFERV